LALFRWSEPRWVWSSKEFVTVPPAPTLRRKER